MDTESPRNLKVEAVYVDGSMVQLETSFTSRHWSARATAYTQFDDIAGFATRLSRLAETCSGEVSFEAGREDSPIGFLSLRFYPVGSSGRIACHLRLGTDAATEHRAEELWTVSAELASEAGALDAFVAGLRRIADTQSGKAVLILSEYVTR
ncbi:MAG: hypothetical protein ACKVYV_05820 [Limisphaerales bacterium]